jgi:hypothetical protein
MGQRLGGGLSCEFESPVQGLTGVRPKHRLYSIVPQPSRESQLDPPFERAAQGPWHDGRYVVVAIGHESEMPSRCMCCNAEIDHFTVERCPIPGGKRPHWGSAAMGLLMALADYAIVVKLLRIVGAFAHVATVQRVALRFGRCTDHPRSTSPRFVAAASAVAGVVLILWGMGINCATLGEGGITQCFVGMAFFGVTVAAAMRNVGIAKATEGFVWVNGFGEAYRQSLPEWNINPKPPPERRAADFSAWFSFLLAVAVFLICMPVLPLLIAAGLSREIVGDVLKFVVPALAIPGLCFGFYSRATHGPTWQSEVGTFTLAIILTIFCVVAAVFALHLDLPPAVILQPQ